MLKTNITLAGTSFLFFQPYLCASLFGWMGMQHGGCLQVKKGGGYKILSIFLML